jgi:Clr5 domain
MEPHTYQGTGYIEDDSWSQPIYDPPFPGVNMTTFPNPFILQPGMVRLDPDGNPSFDNSFFASHHASDLMQPPGGISRTAQESQHNINNFISNGNRSQQHTHTNASIPRNSLPTDQLQNLFAPSFPMADNDNEPQQPLDNATLVEEDLDESEYVTTPRTPHVSKRARKPLIPNPSPEEWERSKPEIQSLYFGNHTLKDTKTEMERRGFHAESVTVLSLSLSAPESVLY